VVVDEARQTVFDNGAAGPSEDIADEENAHVWPPPANNSYAS
jgi:hypothetical protein